MIGGHGWLERSASIRETAILKICSILPCQIDRCFSNYCFLDFLLPSISTSKLLFQNLQTDMEQKTSFWREVRQVFYNKRWGLTWKKTKQKQCNLHIYEIIAMDEMERQCSLLKSIYSYLFYLVKKVSSDCVLLLHIQIYKTLSAQWNVAFKERSKTFVKFFAI